MKIKSLLIVLTIGLVSFTSYKIGNDIIARMGMDHSNAQYHIIRNMLGRFENGTMKAGQEEKDPISVYNQLKIFKIPYASLLPDIIAGDQGAQAKELCEYVRKYVNSVEFAEEYTRLREDAMPLTSEGTSLASLKKDSQVFQLNIESYPNDTEYVAAQKKQLAENQGRIDALVEAAKKPFPDKELWEKAYPADPSIVVKARLNEYLQLAATVDFDAKLSGSGKKQLFVNPTYEKKSLKWKAIYRAGKEVNDVVTSFISEWLKGEVVASKKLTMVQDATSDKTTTAGTTPELTEDTAVSDVKTVEQTGTDPQREAAESTNKKKLLVGKLKSKIKAINNK